MEPQWKYANNEQTCVIRIWPSGMVECCLIIAVQIQEFLANGGQILPKD